MLVCRFSCGTPARRGAKTLTAAPRIWLIVAACSLAASPAGAVNLLDNGSFDADIEGWSVGSQEFIQTDWSTRDVVDSGSLRIWAGTSGEAFQCVTVTGGTAYLLGGSIYEVDEGGDANFGLAIRWYDDAVCSGSLVGASLKVDAPAAREVWHDLEQPVSAPPTAGSTIVSAAFNWSSGAFSFMAHYDSVYLVPSAAPDSANLISNGDFDSDIVSWGVGSQEFIQLDWDTRDQIDSGSILVWPGVSGNVFQCVEVTPGVEHALRGSVYELDETGNASYGLGLSWFSSKDCSGSPTGGRLEIFPLATREVWHNLDTGVTAPGNANSARFDLVFTSVSGTTRAHYDALELPEPGSAAGAAGALGVLALLARRRRRYRLAKSR